jgi:hypothetical protein
MERGPHACHIESMNFVVEMVFVEPPGPASDAGLPTERLPGKFGTIALATEAGYERIRQLDRPLGSVFFKILDRNGDPVEEAGG